MFFFSPKFKDILSTVGALPKELACARQIELIVLKTFFLRPRFNKNVPVRWAPFVPHWCSKPHTPINFPNIWTREKYVANFKVKCRYQPPLEKNLEKKSKFKFFFPAPQSFNLGYWPQNAPCKIKARSNDLTRPLNRHKFLSINIDSS